MLSFQRQEYYHGSLKNRFVDILLTENIQTDTCKISTNSTDSEAWQNFKAMKLFMQYFNGKSFKFLDLEKCALFGHYGYSRQMW